MLHLKKGKIGYTVLKIDLEKAYDKIEWPFLLYTLKDLNFPNHWISLIYECLISNTISVLWNGSTWHPFTPKRGLRQRDSLSLYLFVLCSEKLSHLIMEKVFEREWVGIKASRDGPSFSHFVL